MKDRIYRDTKSWMKFLCRWVAWPTDSCFDIHCSNNSVRIRFLTTDPYRLVQSILYGIVNLQSVPARRKWNNWCGVCHDIAASQKTPTVLLLVGQCQRMFSVLEFLILISKNNLQTKARLPARVLTLLSVTPI